MVHDFHLFILISSLTSVALYLQEERRKAEEAEAQLNMQLAQEAAHAKMARDISNEVC